MTKETEKEFTTMLTRINISETGLMTSILFILYKFLDLTDKDFISLRTERDMKDSYVREQNQEKVVTSMWTATNIKVNGLMIERTDTGFTTTAALARSMKETGKMETSMGREHTVMLSATCTLEPGRQARRVDKEFWSIKTELSTRVNGLTIKLLGKHL